MSNPSQFDPWQVLTSVLDAGHPRILVFGPPGTGKSYTPCVWAQSHRYEVLAVTLTEETPMTELRGHFILRGNTFVWHDGLMARAWRLSHSHPAGVVIVLNEIDHAGGDVQTFLHNALDDPEMARLDLPTGETLRPAVGKVIVVATMNGRPEDLPEALRDRFPVALAMDKPNPAAVAGLPADLQALASNSPTSRDEDRRVTPRALYAFASLREHVGAPMAAYAVFGQAAPDLLNAITLAERR